MLFIPLPFIIATMLFLLLSRFIYERGMTKNVIRFQSLIGCYTLSSIVIGLRWGYGMTNLLPFMSILGSIIPPLAWSAYNGLTTSKHTRLNAVINVMPPITVLCLLLVFPDAIDLVLILIYLIYAFALLHLATEGPDALIRASLSHAVLAHRALMATSAMLIMSAMVDGFIAFDFAKYGGIHAAGYVSVASLLTILILGTAAALAGTSQPNDVSDELESHEPAQASIEDITLVEQVDKFIIANQLFRDPDLTLNRLSRKMAVSARRISTAINRVRGESVSVYMNRHRVTEACRLLKETDQPITGIMFESGFQTKSNFNDSFKKITGTNPASWRSLITPVESKS
jgi:AraC-like DNA-binding protein